MARGDSAFVPADASGNLGFMSGLFASGGRSDEPWLRVGRVEVSTVVVVVAIVVASWLAAAIAPGLPSLFFYTPEAVAVGEVWRIATWPLANAVSLWGVLNLFFFWYFGTELENTIGRVRMLWLLLGVWASLTVAATAVGLLLGGGAALAGIGLVQFVLLLLWVAENPRRPMFFGIPAWVLGLVLVGLQVLNIIAARDTVSLLTLVLGLVLVAIVGRSVGLLTAYSWIPGRRRKASASPSRSRAARAQARHDQRNMSDRDKLDALLDKINEQGIHGLSAAERRELGRLRDRLRKR